RSATAHGAWSSPASFSTKVVDLPAPTLLSPADGSTGDRAALTFSWSAVPGADEGYRILVATTPDAMRLDPDAGMCADCVIDAAVTATSYKAPADVLGDTTTYYWQVQARSSRTYGTWSSPAGFTTKVVEYP